LDAERLEEAMRTFDAQNIELDVPPADAFRYLANPATLPEWTHAFKAADSRQATVSTPQGTVQVGLRMDASEEYGTVDWTMTFPTCLDRPHRLAYILGEILELEGPEAARILQISAPAFRKRLSRAREAIVEFTRHHCGLVDTDNACRCIRRLPRAQASGRISSAVLLFGRAESARAFPGVLERVQRVESVQRTAALYRATPDADPGPALLERIQAAIDL
jgi:hypothetical protein